MGKRVDFSARSVITPDPNLALGMDSVVFSFRFLFSIVILKIFCYPPPPRSTWCTSVCCSESHRSRNSHSPQHPQVRHLLFTAQAISYIDRQNGDDFLYFLECGISFQTALIFTLVPSTLFAMMVHGGHAKIVHRDIINKKRLYKWITG